MRYVQYIPKNLCNIIQAKKIHTKKCYNYGQRHPIIMTDADYDYIVDEIERSEKLSLKRM